jgi:phenylpropionate dioxygenase-like ring-hydroxylating dioxygenase large terminal subunit
MDEQVHIEESPFLRGFWYFAVPGTSLAPGEMMAKTMLGEPILLGRTNQGEVFAIHDICPHRGIPLSCGEFDGATVMCRYHGWRFNPEGRCTEIPSLVKGQDFDVSKIGVKHYPAREVQGNVWVYIGDETENLPEVPQVPGFGGASAELFASMQFPCSVDHAVVGLMDPVHGPFIHESWFWRKRSSMHDKAKKIVPVTMGWRMVRHKPSSNSAGYKLLGGTPETEITFRLPGVRIEHITVGKHTVCGLTAVTPITETTSEVNHSIYWTIPWLVLIKPLLRSFARTFMDQDRQALEMQCEGLKHNPKLLLIQDSDTLATWYYRMKKEYARSNAESRPFENPVRETTLRWRS